MINIRGQDAISRSLRQKEIITTFLVLQKILHELSEPFLGNTGWHHLQSLEKDATKKKAGSWERKSTNGQGS